MSEEIKAAALEAENQRLLSDVKKLDMDLMWAREEMRTTDRHTRATTEWRDGFVRMLETNQEVGQEAWSRNRPLTEPGAS